MCRKDGVAPKKDYSGKFNVRITPTKDFSGKFNLRTSKELHKKIAIEAASEGKSINQWVVDELSHSIEHRI